MDSLTLSRGFILHEQFIEWMVVNILHYNHIKWNCYFSYIQLSDLGHICYVPLFQLFRTRRHLSLQGKNRMEFIYMKCF